MSIRACFPHNFKRLLEYDPVSDSFNGFVGKLATSILDVTSVILNRTIEVQAENLGVGVYQGELERFDGCLGQIQQNRSDIMIQMSPYPLKIDDVSQGLIIYETNLAFVSAYNKTEISGSMQVLKSFEAFSPDLWIICIVSCFVMSMMLTLREMMLNQRKYGENFYNNYQVMVHCTRLGSMDDTGATRRVIFMCASIYSLLVVHYLSSMIKTELVVIKDPLVFKSYDDIITRKAVPLFFKGMSYDALFRDAKTLHSRKRLWEYAMKSYGEDRLYAEMSPLLFLVVSLSVLTQKAVVILDDALMPLVRTSGCSLAGRDFTKIPALLKLLKQPEQILRMMQLAGLEQNEQRAFFRYLKNNDLSSYSPTEALIHVSRDEEEQSYFQGIVYTDHSQTTRKLIESSVRTVIEAGLAHHQLKSMEEVNLFGGDTYTDGLLGPPLRSRRSFVERCKSESIIQPSHDLEAMRTDNFRSLFSLMAWIQSLLLAFLIVETIFARLTSARIKHNHRERIGSSDSHRE